MLGRVFGDMKIVRDYVSEDGCINLHYIKVRETPDNDDQTDTPSPQKQEERSPTRDDEQKKETDIKQ